MEQALEIIVWAPADAVRRSFLRAMGPVARRLINDRGLRVTIFGVGIVITVLAAMSFFPLWVMALGPVLIGTPHLVADIRYLVIRPGLHRTLGFWVAIGLPLAVAYVLPGVIFGMFAVAGALLISRASPGRRLLGMTAWAIIYFALVKAGRSGNLAILSFHNLLTLGIWWSWRPRGRSREIWVLVAFVAASAVILSGATEPLVRWAHGFRSPESGLSFAVLARSILPLRMPGLAFRLVLWYGFAQAVHYSTWLRLVPEDDRVRPTPRTFSSSWRALTKDFGRLGLTVVVVAALGLAVWSAFDLRAARAGYTRAAGFHFELEFAILALCWAEGHRPGRASPAAEPSSLRASSVTLTSPS